MRLTEKVEFTSDCSFELYRPRKYVSIPECCNKLGQLEDIADNLGIDLVTFLKAFTQEDIYLKDKKNNVCCCDYEVTYNRDKNGWYFKSILLGKFYFKDYGKTWALTEKELE